MIGLPGFGAEDAISTSSGQYRTTARYGRSAEVVSARQQGDRPSGGQSDSNGSCVDNCAGDCADLLGQARLNCIAKCKQSCIPPEVTESPGQGSGINININITKNDWDTFWAIWGISSFISFGGGFSECVREGGEMSMTADGVTCKQSWPKD
jgi:hypothetical protein